MSINLYDIAVPVFIRSLTNLVSLLKKAEYQANLKGYPASLLLQSRLYPDMYELSRQITRAAELAINGVEKLSGHTAENYSTDIQTVEQHIAYVNHSIGYLLTVPPRKFQDSEQKQFPLPPENQETYSGLGYTLFYLLPNFYFHVTTAYNILRHNGIEIGKRDYIGYEQLRTAT